MNQKGEIKIYEGENGSVRVEAWFENETLWLSQKEIVSLFQTDQSVISRHISNIIKSGELDEKSNMQKMHIANSDRPVKFYSLDMVLSVGYRVNSKKATAFRIWANKILKNYLTRGYAINDRKFFEIQKIIQFITEKAKISELSGHEKEVLEVIEKYSKTWEVLGQYDEGKIEIAKVKKTKFKLNFYKCRELINQLKEDLIHKKMAGDLFGQERDHQLEAIFNNLYQTFDGNELYNSIEEKAAHLLYFVIKDHPFSDGNKRLGSLLFLYFLERNNFLFKENGEAKISDRTLVALALLVATSDPKEKRTMIRLIISLVQN